MSENKDQLKKENENLSLISGGENQLSRDTPAAVKGFFCYGRCPRCGNSVDGPRESYCCRCGQALLWPAFSKTAADDSLKNEITDMLDLTGEAEEKKGQSFVQQEPEAQDQGHEKLL